jgi:hypothetical protein
MVIGFEAWNQHVKESIVALVYEGVCITRPNGLSRRSRQDLANESKKISDIIATSALLLSFATALA